MCVNVSKVLYVGTCIVYAKHASFVSVCVMFNVRVTKMFIWLSQMFILLCGVHQIYMSLYGCVDKFYSNTIAENILAGQLQKAV